MNNENINNEKLNDKKTYIKEGNFLPWNTQVRDYECDGYGGVNHATYLNYMEEARKWYLAVLNFDLAALAKRNIGFVVTRYEVDYRLSLVSGDEFVVETKMERISRIQVQFTQNIFRLPDRKIVVKSINFGVPINIKSSRPEWPEEIEKLMADFPIRKIGSKSSLK